MLEIRGVNKTYQTGGLKTKALDNININFRVNEFVAILGPSGSGKTTLLNIIGGLDHYTSGDIKINEISLLLSGGQRVGELLICLSRDTQSQFHISHDLLIFMFRRIWTLHII